MIMFKKGESLSADINFPKVLFLHLNRISQSQNNDIFIANVEMLESLLCPYVDDEYFKDLKIPDKEFKNVMALDTSTSGRDELVTTKKFTLTQEKFRALMRLANRRNLLIEKVGEGYDDEYAEGYDTVEKKV